MPKNRSAIGPYSRGSSLAKVDGRTRSGRFIATIRNELTHHVGSPSAPQRILIELAAILALRIALLSGIVLSTEAIEERDDRQLVAWMNALARTVEKLGLDRKTAPLSIVDYLAEKGSR